jgi:hypothetical protein
MIVGRPIHQFYFFITWLGFAIPSYEKFILLRCFRHPLTQLAHSASITGPQELLTRSLTEYKTYKPSVDFDPLANRNHPLVVQVEDH